MRTILWLTTAAALLPSLAHAQTADLILISDRIWTGDPSHDSAEAIAMRGDRIHAVGDRASIMALRDEHTRVLELTGACRFVAPGFIDNHTHFERAGSLLLGVNLLDVADEVGLVRRVREAKDRLPAGSWLVDGQWGAYEQRGVGGTGREQAERPRTEFQPQRAMIDSITPETPALLSKWDRSTYLANERALELAGADCTWAGVECQDGHTTGRLSPDAASRIRRLIPPKPLEQRLAESRAALAHLAELGVTTIHDNTSPDQLEVYQLLLANGELTTRVYAGPRSTNGMSCAQPASVTASATNT